MKRAALVAAALVLAACTTSRPTVARPNPDGPYPMRQGITATEFWVGEPADADNHFIPNAASAWVTNWEGEFGGVDDPNHRCAVYFPCFEYKENPFYVALPFDDYDDAGDLRPTSDLSRIYWFRGPPPVGNSLVKNRWIKVTKGSRTAYAQWEDVGPINENDVHYTFGAQRPAYRVGLDLSPATAVAVGLGGEGTVSWSFVRADQVPDGPWRTKVTTSGVDW